MSGESALAAQMAAEMKRLNVYLDAETLAEIDKLRRERSDFPSRALVIREVLKIGLAAMAAAKKAKN